VVFAPFQDMKKTEDDHLAKMNELVVDRRVRPTALLPIWHLAGFALGAGSALLGKEAAMACTVAVEEVISEHYNDQIRTLLEKGYPEDELKEVCFWAVSGFE
jgi:3-demethoxyubiquinol 3-hydroxylase